jgi:hypothetical protein
MKCCNWFFFNHAGITWHAKNATDAKIKGVDEKFLEIGKLVNFLGLEIHIPKMPGSWLDACYPDWATPRPGGSSRAQYSLTVDCWSNKKKWKVNKYC